MKHTLRRVLGFRLDQLLAEEFAIYLNYVRKLGFEETPDYDFLRELFAKVLKNNGDVEDGVYDWNLLNGETPGELHECVRGETKFAIRVRWKRLGSVNGMYKLRVLLSTSTRTIWFFLLTPALASQGGGNQILAQIQNTPATPQQQYDSRRTGRGDRDDRRRASQAGNPVIPPSPALVRAGSKSRHPGALTPGVGGTPNMSAEAQVNVPVAHHRLSQHQQGGSHPYANAAYDAYGRDEYSASQQPYGRASPMVSSVGAAPPALSNVRAMGGEVGVANGGDYHGQHEAEPPKNTLWKILTCRCG